MAAKMNGWSVLVGLFRQDTRLEPRTRKTLLRAPANCVVRTLFTLQNGTVSKLRFGVVPSR